MEGGREEVCAEKSASEVISLSVDMVLERECRGAQVVGLDCLTEQTF